MRLFQTLAELTLDLILFIWTLGVVVLSLGGPVYVREMVCF